MQGIVKAYLNTPMKTFREMLKILEEAKKSRKPNPWAVCTASVGREDKAKYERCVMHIKHKHGIKK